MSEEPKKLHPEAFRELKPGETCDPIVPASPARARASRQKASLGARRSLSSMISAS